MLVKSYLTSIQLSTYLLNIKEFVYFVCGLSPPKRRVVRWRNFAHTRDDHVQDMCWVLCLQGSSLRK